MIKVIFDMDGTLLDTQTIYIPAWEEAGKKQGFTGMGNNVKYVCGTNNEGSGKFLKEHFPTLDIPLFRKHYEEYVNEHLVVRYKKGVKETLDFLKENGIEMAVASGTDKKRASARLKAVDCMDYFKVTIFGDEVENGKPAPDIFLKTAALMGAKPEECIIFEDSGNGIRAANNAGIRCIGIPDVVEFNSEIKSMLLAEYNSMDESIELLKELIK